MDKQNQNGFVEQQVNFIQKLNELSRKLTSDHKKNIDIIVKYANQMLGGVCSLYNKLDKRDNSLLCWAKENTPADLPKKNIAKGHICYEATIKGQNKIIAIPDISKTPYQQSDPYIKKYNIKSYLGFPVKTVSLSLGSLCVLDTKIRKFSELEISTIEHLANLIRVQEEKLKVENIQTLLYKISRTLITSQSLEELSHQLKNILYSIIDSSNFSLVIFDKSNQISEFLYHDQNLEMNSNSVDYHLIDMIKSKNESILINKDKLKKILPSNIDQNKICNSWLGVPLKIENEAIGVICLKSYNKQTFLQEDVKLMEFVSFEIALIIKEKKLKDELKRKEEEYRSIFDQSTMGIYRTDFEGNILMVNDALVEMLEYETQEELLNLDLSKNYHPYYKRKYFIQSLLENGIIKNKYNIWTTKYGNQIIINETAKLIQTEDREIIEGTVENISDEVATKNAYQFEKEKFNNLMSTVSIGILQVDKNKKLIYHNEQFEKITGYSKDDLKTIDLFYQKVIDEKQLSLNNFSDAASIKIIKTKNGDQKFIKILQTKSISDNYIITIEDITGSIESKQALIEQSKYLSAINSISNKLISNKFIPYEEILDIMGNTLNISQINLYKYFRFDDRVEIQNMAQWTNDAENIESQYLLKHQFYDTDSDFPNWGKKFADSDYIFGTTDSYLNPEKAYLEKNNIKSIFIHNIKVNNQPFAFIVLKCHKEKRIWIGRDIMFIQTIINNVTKTIEQKLMNTQLMNSKTSYLELFKNSSSGIVIFDQKGIIENINPTAEKLFQKKHNELVGNPSDLLSNSTDITKNINSSIKFCNTVNSPKNIDIIINNKDNVQALDLHFKKIHYFDKSCIIMYVHDITLRYQKEYEIRKNLNEKQTLLQEIHHRVKNNLQIISSLLNLQLKDVETEKDKSLFIDSQNRIKSIALIHESLYNSRNLSKINFKEYTEKLINRLFAVFKVDTDQIKPVIDIPNIELNIKKAIPCGLILDELITNSLKYAFPDNRKGKIEINLSQLNGNLKLFIKDSGIGFDSQKLIKNKTTLGFELIITLTKQLKGDYKLVNDQGFGIEILFPN